MGQSYVGYSMIDMFLTTNKSLFNNVKAIPSVSMDSDHRMVIANINLARPKEKAGRRRLRLKLEKLRVEDCARELRNKMENTTDIDKNEEIDEIWRKFGSNVTQISRDIRDESYKTN